MISETWDYYTTTCQGEDCIDPYNAMLCPMDNSSGGGTGDAEGWEFAVTKDVQWTVKSGGIGGANIQSAERIKGKRNSNWPGGGYFTSISHYDSWCSCPTNGIWFPNTSNSYVEVILNGVKTRSYVEGGVTYQGTVYPYSNTGTWLFDEVF